MISTKAKGDSTMNGSTYEDFKPHMVKRTHNRKGFCFECGLEISHKGTSDFCSPKCMNTYQKKTKTGAWEVKSSSWSGRMG